MNSKLFVLFSFFLTVNLSLGLTVSNTYTAGDIPAFFNSYDPTCNGAATPLSVTLPVGGPWIVTSVDVTYDMTSASGTWKSEQFSRMACQNTTFNEGAYFTGNGNSGGVQGYSRSGLNIANGQYVGGTNLVFELQAYRTFGNNGVCNTTNVKINDGTWEVVVNYELAQPMVYVGSSYSNSILEQIENCATSAELIKIEIETSGLLSPLNVSSFDLSTVGTTNIGEMNAINVYFTGNSNSFNTGTLFGTVLPGGAVTVNGSVDLLAGTNYFWVEYGLIPTLTNGNVFDCNNTGLMLDGNNILPTEIAPFGSRLVSVCNPAPGGIVDEQVWLKSELGTVGTAPVTSWGNLGINTTVTALTSTAGTQLNLAQPNLNFHDGIKLAGNYAGTFHQTVPNRTDLISGDEVTMFVVTDGGQDLSLAFHSTGNGANQWHSFGFRHAGMGVTYSGGAVGDAYNPNYVDGNMNIYGMRGESGLSGENTSNGMKMQMANVGTFSNSNTTFELAVGWWPGFGNSNSYTEAIIWDKKLNAAEFHIVETYLAIKYGVTLGVNGVAMDYNSATNAVIWNATSNSGYAYDIAGISRSDVSVLDQRKSHSVNGSSTTNFDDLVTISNGTDFSNPQLMNDESSLIWGHNGLPSQSNGTLINYATDNGQIIEKIFQRHWKSQETGNVGDVMLEFDLSSVPGVSNVNGNNDLSNLRLLVDEDGDFTSGATAYSPVSFNNATNIAYFQTNFTASDGNNLTTDNGFFFTLGSTDYLLTPLPVKLISFNGECIDEFSRKLTWKTKSEENNDYFLVEKSEDGVNWEAVARVSGNGTISSESEYEVRDADNSSYMTYYRLKQVDFDGKLTIISNIKLECENTKPIIYPNPFTSELFIQFKSEGTYRVMVRDVLGRLVYNNEFVETNLSTKSIDLNELISTGMYYVSILKDEKTILLNEKIIKN